MGYLYVYNWTIPAIDWLNKQVCDKTINEFCVQSSVPNNPVLFLFTELPRKRNFFFQNLNLLFQKKRILRFLNNLQKIATEKREKFNFQFHKKGRSQIYTTFGTQFTQAPSPQSHAPRWAAHWSNNQSLKPACCHQFTHFQRQQLKRSLEYYSRVSFMVNDHTWCKFFSEFPRYCFYVWDGFCCCWQIEKNTSIFWRAKYLRRFCESPFRAISFRAYLFGQGKKFTSYEERVWRVFSEQLDTLELQITIFLVNTSETSIMCILMFKDKPSHEVSHYNMKLLIWIPISILRPVITIYTLTWFYELKNSM